MPPFEPVDNEQQARAYGRARAKEIFQPMRWKRIGALPDEAAKLYESTHRSSPDTYSVRAVKSLQATLAEVEAVFTQRIGPDDAPSLLAHLLPSTYVSGGPIAHYPTLEHATRERENVTVQYARLKPYTAKQAGHTRTNARLADAVDNFVLLGYTLSTRLQRSDTRLKKTAGTLTPRTITSVPSLLHLYHPVSAPLFAERRPDFQPHRLARHDFTITYIIQELASSREGEAASVTLEVILTWSLDPQTQDTEATVTEAMLQGKHRLRHDALCLTRLQPLINALRQEKMRPSVATKGTPALSSPDGNMVPTKGRICGVCQRKFGPFRWKKSCKGCDKLVCNQCLNNKPLAVSRRKHRVCTQCTLEDPESGTKTQSKDPGKVLSAGDSGMNVFQIPNLEALVRTPVDPEPRDPPSSTRVEIDLGLDPALHAATARGRSRAPSRHSDLSLASPLSTLSATSNVGVSPPHRLQTVETLKDTAAEGLQALRTQRAKTVQLEETPIKHVTRRSSRSSSCAPSPAVDDSATKRTLCTTDAVDDSATKRTLCTTDAVDDSATKRTLCTTDAVDDSGVKRTLCTTDAVDDSVVKRTPCTTDIIELPTPELDYELDFSWYHSYPKAPVVRRGTELDRANYVELTGFKIDARSVVYLRQDAALEALAHQVLGLASHWHGCSLNVIGSFDVYCLVTVSTRPELDVDSDVLELETSPVLSDAVVAREESVSAHAVHHQSVFFVPDLAQDVRFRAHPLHTDHGAASFLSVPLYATSATSSDVYCVATLDLWTRTAGLAPRGVPTAWLQRLQALGQQMIVRLEALASEAQACLKPRGRATHSLSSCESRTSTGRANSVTDLYDIDSESVVECPPCSIEPFDRLTNLSYAKVRGYGLGGVTWKYDSDNDSTTSSQSASSSCSQSSRFSSQLYSAADLHSTIESLLYQASKTSQYLSETGVSI